MDKHEADTVLKMVSGTIKALPDFTMLPVPVSDLDLQESVLYLERGIIDKKCVTTQL